MQTYLLDGISLSYLELSQAEAVSYISRGLQEFCAYYSNQMSYAEVAGIVARQCGARVLSPQAIWQLVHVERQLNSPNDNQIDQNREQI